MWSRDFLGEIGPWSLVKNTLARWAVNHPNRNSKLNRNHKIHLKHSYSLILLKSDFIHPTLTLLNRLSLWLSVRRDQRTRRGGLLTHVHVRTSKSLKPRTRTNSDWCVFWNIGFDHEFQTLLHRHWIPYMSVVMWNVLSLRQVSI